MQAPKRETPKPQPVVHELTIPDELLEWGRDQTVCRHWTRPWAHEIVRLLQHAWQSDSALAHEQTEALLSRLEALCVEAINAGREELLLGLDLFTADWLGLRFEFEREDGKTLTFGRGGKFRYRELHALLAGPVSSETVAFAERCGELVRSVFPRGQISAIIETEDQGPGCAGCGSKDCTTMVSMQTGTEYCAPCWKSLTEEWPSLDELLGKGKKGKKKR